MRPVSPALKRLIDRANWIPPESETYWREFCDFLEPQIRLWQDVNRPEYADDPISIMSVVKPWSEWESYLEHLPKRFRDFLWSRRDRLREMLDRACFFVAARETLTHIARMRSQMKKIRLRGMNLPATTIPIPAIQFAPDAFLNLRLSKSGLIEVDLGEIASALASAEADRIRECDICGRIFWAGRSDQKCCTPKCAKVLRTRRWRANYQDKYIQQRYQKAEQHHPLGHKEKRAKEEGERQQLASLKEPTRPHRPAPRLPGPALKSKR